MKRGEIWTMAGGPGYASKPRPVVIVQDDAFTARDSIVVCLITTVPRSRLGQCIGCLADDDRLQLNRSLLVFLGLAR